MLHWTRSGAITELPVRSGKAGSVLRPGPVLAICGLLAFGLVATWYMLPLVERFGPAAACAALLVLPAMALIGFSALQRAFIKWREFRIELRWWHWLWLLVLASGFV